MKGPRFYPAWKLTSLAHHGFTDSIKSHETQRSETKDFIIQEISVARVSAFSCSSSINLTPKGQLKEGQGIPVPTIRCIREDP